MKVKKLLSILLCLVLAASLLPGVARAETTGVTYLDSNGELQTYTGSVATLSRTTNKLGAVGQSICYYVTEDVALGVANGWKYTVAVYGDVTLIIAPGVTLSVPFGLLLMRSATLTVYGGNDRSTLRVGDRLSEADDGILMSGMAGIGSICEQKYCPTLTINSGTVIATGGSSGPGIGSCGQMDPYKYAGGAMEVIINGGEVIATGGPAGAGIGTGRVSYAADTSSRGIANVTINGGYVTATGGPSVHSAYENTNYSAGAGIGTGHWTLNKRAGVVTINGGTVNANGAIGIGGSCGMTVNINGGIINSASGIGCFGLNGLNLGYVYVNVEGGRINVSGDMGLGAKSDGHADITIHNGDIVGTACGVAVGASGGHVDVNISGGSVITDDACGAGIGSNGGGGGTFNISGGLIRARGTVGVGANGGMTNVTITGGDVIAEGSSVGIGRAESTWENGRVAVLGGNVTATGGTAGIASDKTLELDWSRYEDSLCFSSLSYNRLSVTGDWWAQGEPTHASASDFSSGALNGKVLRPYLSGRLGNGNPAPLTLLCDGGGLLDENTSQWVSTGVRALYVAEGIMYIPEHVTVSGDVNLLLRSGTYLYAENGITVPQGSSLTVYTDSENGGTLIAYNGDGTSGVSAVDLGGSFTLESGSVIIEATNAPSVSAADGSTVTVNGGSLSAYGEFLSDVEINGGRMYANDELLGDVDINAGSLLAIGEIRGDVEINGGAVEAQSGIIAQGEGSGIRLSWTEPGDQIYSQSYTGPVTLEKEFRLVGAETVTVATTENIAGETIVPHTNLTYYVDENGAMQRCDDAVAVENSASFNGAGWYVVRDQQTLTKVELTGDTDLILADGALLRIGYITVPEGVSLTVYGQSEGTGKLIADASDLAQIPAIGQSTFAGVGASCGSVIVNGGIVEAYGGSGSAAIGTNGMGSRSGGAITVNGGSVTAAGAIGCAAGDNGGSVTINGGTVTADTIGGSNATVTVNGGAVNAGPVGGSGSSVIIKGGAVNAGTIGGSNASVTLAMENDGDSVTGAITGNVTLGSSLGYASDGARVRLRSLRTDDTIVPMTQTPVSYLDGETEDYDPVTVSDTLWQDGWYVAEGEVTLSERVAVSGTVNLVLLDDAQLNAPFGISVLQGNTLNIYSQSLGTNMGALTASGAQEHYAGIGGCFDGEYHGVGAVNIYGGHVTAVGGVRAAGIGGAAGSSLSGQAVYGGDVAIYDGLVDATAGQYASAIGPYAYSSGYSVTISGGTVNAQSSNGAAIGVGDTYNGGCQGTITISGGTVTASTGGFGPAIGGRTGSTEIVISGGDITANSTASGGVGIGGPGCTFLTLGNEYGDDLSVTASAWSKNTAAPDVDNRGSIIYEDDGSAPVWPIAPNRTVISFTGDYDTVILDDGSGETISVSVASGYPIAAPADPVLEGHIFQGWYAQGEEEPFDFAGPILGDLILTARWKAVDYTVTFDSACGTEVESQTVPYGGLASEPEPLTQDHASFLGWFAPDTETPFDFATPITGDLTLTARWEYEACAVTLDSADGGEPAVQQVTYGETVPVPQDPVRSGFTFLGWFASASAAPYDFTAPVTGDLTLTALWGYEGLSAIDGTEGFCTDEDYPCLLDGSYTTKWCVECGSNCQIHFETDSYVIPTGYVLATASDTFNYPGRNPLNWTLQGRRSGSDEWITLASVNGDTTLQAVNETPFRFDVDTVSVTGLRYFRFTVTALKDETTLQLSELALTGAAAPETIPTVTVTYAPGDGGEAFTADVPEGTLLALPDCPFTAPEGLVFDGWQTAAGDVIPAHDCFVPDDDVTLTAVFRERTAWEQLQQQLNAGGTVRLTSDVTAGPADSPLLIPEGVSVTLDLNGHTLDRGLSDADEPLEDGNVITVLGALTVSDTSVSRAGMITGGFNSGDGGGIVVLDVGTPVGPVLMDDEPTASGSLTLTGGSITGNYSMEDGGGVCVECGGFTMTGGAITGNYSIYGGGVYVEYGSFTMTGGTVSENESEYGSGVYVEYGSFTMTGGAVTGNRARDFSGAGVEVYGEGLFLSGSPVIDGNFNIYNDPDDPSVWNLYCGSYGTPFTVTSPLTALARIGVFTNDDSLWVEDEPVFIGTLSDPADAARMIPEVPELTIVIEMTGEGIWEAYLTQGDKTARFFLTEEDALAEDFCCESATAAGGFVYPPADPGMEGKVFSGWYLVVGKTTDDGGNEIVVCEEEPFDFAQPLESEEERDSLNFIAGWSESVLPPAAPASVSVEATAGKIIVTWTEAEGADHYRIARQSTGTNWMLLDGNVSGLTYTDDTVEAGKRYRYAVCGENEAGKGTSATSVAVEAVPALTVPGAVESISAEAQPGTIVVSWTEAKGADHYRIARQSTGTSWTLLDGNVSGLTFTDDTVEAGKRYRYVVCGENEAGKGTGATSIAVETIPTLTVPGAVESITAEAQPGMVVVSWTEAEGADHYRIARQSTGTNWMLLDGNVSGLTYTDETVEAGKRYRYVVCGENEAGKGTSATSVAVEAVPALTVPGAVESITAEAQPGMVVVSWTEAEGADHYRIARQSTGTNWMLLDGNVSGLTYTDETVEAGKRYRYLVCAENGSGKGTSATSVAVEAIPSLTVPGAVESITAEAQPGMVVVSWTEAEGADHYRIARQSTGTNWMLLDGNVSGLTFTDDTVEAGKRYRYTVCAENGSGKGTSATSVAVEAIPSLTVPGAVESITAEAQPGMVVVSWTEAEGAEHYRIARQSTGTNWMLLDGNVSGLTYTDDTVEAGKRYRYAVCGENEAGKGNSATSIAVEAIPTLTVPGAVESITAEAQPGMVVVSWTEAEGADHYRIARQSTGTNWTLLDGNFSGLTYTDDTVEAGKRYRYLVCAENGSGKGNSATSIAVEAIPSLTVPGAVESITAEAQSGMVVVSWTEAEGADHYRIARQSTGTNWMLLDGNVSGLTYMDKTVEAGKRYRYLVCAENGSGKGNSATSIAVEAIG